MCQEEFDPDLLQEIGSVAEPIQHVVTMQENSSSRNGDAVRNALVQYCQDTDM